MTLEGGCGAADPSLLFFGPTEVEGRGAAPGDEVGVFCAGKGDDHPDCRVVVLLPAKVVMKDVVSIEKRYPSIDFTNQVCNISA